MGFEDIRSIVLIGTNTPPDRTMRSPARRLLGVEAGATILGMPKEDDIVSSNGASSNGASPYPSVTPEEWAEINAQRASLRKMHEELVAEGIDGTDLLPELRARAATWSQ